jgi:acetyl-CoA C-acetyltransferase
VILSASRTPIGSFQGVLASVPAPRLGAVAIRGAIIKAGIEPSEITDCLMGNVLQAGQGQAPARQAALFAGLPASVRCTAINKVCGSGMQSIIVASHLLGDGMGQVAVAGGMENMSLAPYLLPKARDGYRLGHQQVVDSLITDGLWDPYHNLHMGNCAEQCAEKYHFTREQQDAYASESFRRANAAQEAGHFAAEITPVELPDGKGGAARVEHDEGPARVRYDRIPTLKPSFQRDGTITPANASSINDGAAALVLTSANHAKSRGLKPIARIVSFGAHAQDPVWFTTAPAPAVRSALSTAGWSVADVDLWEVSEAFAVVAMTFMHELQVPHDKLNVNGGGIALGHPIGCSGARILVTLLASLQRRGLKRGVAAICIGGGEALATCVELL